MLALLGLLVGAALALLVHPTIPQNLTRYVAMAVVVAIDSSLGGVRSSLERTFHDRIFILAFISNAAVGMFLVWVGDQLGADFTTAVVVVFGIRIFQNLAAIRRRVFGG